MFVIIKLIYLGSVELWENDRKEFWDLYLGIILIVIMFWFSLWVLIPIFGD
jgi:hypothetical protein